MGVPPGVPEMCVDIEFCPMSRTHVASWKGPLDGAGDPPGFNVGMIESCILLPRCASQFDPAIDKKRKLISNLRWNMLVLLDSSECAALRADMEGDRLNS